MNHHIPSVLAALLTCAATAVPAGTATARHAPEPSAFTPGANLPGPCFMGGLWDEHAAGPPPICFRRLGPASTLSAQRTRTPREPSVHSSRPVAHYSAVRGRPEGACFVSAPAHWQVEAMGPLPACSAKAR